jgi:DNA-binding CsgD family transcriptional regulator
MRHERGRPPHPELLTPAEQRVLAELRSGRPNAEIAVRLGVSVNTVRYHVSNILAKLEAPNRAALRSWNGEPRRKWGWFTMWGFRFGRGLPAMGKLALSVGVATVGAGLLVVGSGRVTLPSMVEEAPVAVASAVVEPPDVEASGARLLDRAIYGCLPSVVSYGTSSSFDEPERRVDSPVAVAGGPATMVLYGEVVKCPAVAYSSE